MEKSGGEFLPCILPERRTNHAGTRLRCKFPKVSESHISKLTALDVPKPVRILPIYSTGVYTGLGVRARVSHPSAKGTLRASRAMRRPNRSRSGPHSKHPSGVAMDATLAETGNEYKWTNEWRPPRSISASWTWRRTEPRSLVDVKVVGTILRQHFR